VTKLQKILTGCLVVLISIAFAMSYFSRPHDPNVEIVNALQELPDPSRNYPLDTGLAERISRSHGLALVLVISEFTQKNALALDSLRSWARQNYLRDAGFLHNDLPEPVNKHTTIVESLCYSLFAAPSSALRESALNFVRDQIAEFHNTPAFEKFRSDYFDSFGLEMESALLLARYQSDKAKASVDVLLTAGFWIIVFVVGSVLALRSKPGVRTTRLQRILAYFYVIMAIYYLCSAWSQNQMVFLISAWILGWIGIYIRRPVYIELGEDKQGLSFRVLTPSRSVIALGYWATFSLIAIQILTWIKTGSLMNPDPVSLLISCFTGNFLYDPTSAKKAISQAVGIAWILVSLWVFREVTVGAPAAEVEQELASLNEVTPKEEVLS
jgi:hypothetical protein